RVRVVLERRDVRLAAVALEELRERARALVVAEMRRGLRDAARRRARPGPPCSRVRHTRRSLQGAGPRTRLSPQPAAGCARPPAAPPAARGPCPSARAARRGPRPPCRAGDAPARRARRARV